MRTLAWTAALVLVVSWTDPSRCLAEEFAQGQRWGFELGFGAGWTPESDYTRTLEQFGFSRDDVFDSEDDFIRLFGTADERDHFRFSAAVERVVIPYFSVLLQTNLLNRETFHRASGAGGPDDTFNVRTWALGAHARAFLPSKNGRVRGYVQGGVGPTFTATRLRTTLERDAPQTEFLDRSVRYHIAALGGFEGLVGKHIGFFVQGGYIFAPTVKNLFGERLQSGGGQFVLGMTGRFGRRP